jgi:hypothetical protein
MLLGELQSRNDQLSVKALEGTQQNPSTWQCHFYTSETWVQLHSLKPMKALISLKLRTAEHAAHIWKLEHYLRGPVALWLERKATDKREKNSMKTQRLHPTAVESHVLSLCAGRLPTQNGHSRGHFLRQSFL